MMSSRPSMTGSTPMRMLGPWQRDGLDEELLNVIYTQMTVREATKRYHVVKRNAHRC